MVSRPLEINTSASIRNRATIGGLLELGHSVDLISTAPDPGHPSYDANALSPGVDVRYIGLDGLHRLRGVGRSGRLMRPLRRLAYNLLSGLQVYDLMRGMVDYAPSMAISDDQYDLIISSSDPKSSHLFVCRLVELGMIRKTPWIQIWGDPFLRDISRRFGLRSASIRREEEKLLGRASKIVYLSPLTLTEQQGLYPSLATKMEYVPAPYVRQEIYPIKPLGRDPLLLLYCGDYSSRVRNIRPLYEAVNRTHHRLIVCGDGDITLEPTERIEIHSRASYQRVKEMEGQCDVLVNLSNLRGAQIPGKVYQYSGTNKPVLFILDGRSDDLRSAFEGYRRYVFCENDVESIRTVLLNPSCWEDRVVNQPVEAFSPTGVASRIVDLGDGGVR